MLDSVPMVLIPMPLPMVMLDIPMLESVPMVLIPMLPMVPILMPMELTATWLGSSLIPFAQINHNRISNYLLPKLRKTSKYDC